MIFRSLKPIFLTILLLLTLSGFGICEDTKKTDEEKSEKNPTVEQLIEQLGSPVYKERIQAEKKLLKLNIEAFLPLFRAQEHKDPEIASRARYLVRKIQTNLVMPSDSAKVANLMQNIFSLNYSQQAIRVTALSRLPHGEGLDALCRLILFSESEISAHTAAQGLMKARLYDKEDPTPLPVSRDEKIRRLSNGVEIRLAQRPTTVRPPTYPIPSNKNDPGKPLGPKEREKIRRNLKSCDRPSAKLVLLYLDFDEPKTDDEKKTLYNQWHKLCEKEENSAIRQGLSAMDGILISLLEIQLDKAEQLNLDDDTLIQLVRRLLMKNRIWNQANYSTMVNRLIQEKAWKLADISVLDFHEVLQKSNNNDFLPRFFCLLIQSGKTKIGTDLLEMYANRFSWRGTSKANELIKLAEILVEEGLFDQAIAQFQAAIDAENGLFQNGMPERLACWDAYKRIMDVHEERGEFEKAQKTAEKMLAQTKDIPDRYKNRSTVQEIISDAKSCSVYYEVLIAKQKGNDTEYRKLLEKAINLSPDSVKVLVECYRLPVLNAEDKKFHERIVQQIEKTAKSLMGQTSSGRRSAAYYRNYQANLLERAHSAAWLIVNTEGSLSLAIATLEKTMRMNPANKSARTLTTLARCYSKRNESHKALPFIREAMERSPHDKQVQEAWAQISSDYEKKNGDKPEPPKTGKERFRSLVGLSSASN